jgi:sarcosine oxidase
LAVYDTIVVGLGAMGSSTLYHLSRRGQRVLGLEAFVPGHRQGSSHGESRIIRLAYYEHTDYVPLLFRAYELWDELQRASGQDLLRITGGLMIGRAEGELVQGAAASARVHGLAHEMLDAADLRRRYQVFQPDDDQVALWEPRAGLLFPERCIASHVALARSAGAEAHFEEPVVRWSVEGDDSVTVTTGRATYQAEHVVFTPGAWLGKVLPDIALPFAAERIPVFWLKPVASPEAFAFERLPIYLWDLEEDGHFYGFPHLEWPGVKVARHHSGDTCDPDTVDRVPNVHDEERLRAVLARYLPALNGPVESSLICLYENTPDLHFVVDWHPRHNSVVYAGGFSGHGFKFSSVIGEVLADMVTERRATPAAEFLRAARLGAPASA